MNAVMQDRFGGPDAPPSLQGNCFQACVASLFELPLKDAFDATAYSLDDWFDQFQTWCSIRGLFPIAFKHMDWSELDPPGLMIVSTTMRGIPHAMIAKDRPDNYVHCPSRGNVIELNPTEEPLEVFMFVKLMD